MWRPLKSFRKWFNANHVSAHRQQRHRLYCEPLEDRCLLSGGPTLSGPSEGPVGSPTTWTASVSDLGPSPVYQFSVTPAGGATQMVQDFSTSNSFAWDPLQEGNYTIQVTAKAGYSDTTSETATASYIADSLVTGTSAVVSALSNPLVALYSAPPTSGSSMVVQFSPDVSDPTWQSTAAQPIVPGESSNFLVAGLLPSTTYLMRDVVDNGTPSDPVTFTTGSLPSSLNFPNVTVPQPPGPTTDMTDNMILHMGLGASTPDGNVTLYATDLAGNIDWYYDPVANNLDGYATSLVPGGTILFLGGPALGPTQGGESMVEEMDLAGDTLRETNVDAINAQLAAMGQDTILNINHEAQRLPDGDTAILATNQRVIDGTTYNGDMVIVLDQNFQVKWTWNAFDWLDTSRLPTNGEGPGDWLHANSIDYSPADGNLLVSLRAQDWVIKINYDNGAGDGHVVWRLGPDGDFTAISSDPSPWFTHQHDVRYINDNTIVVFDDGNTRALTDPSADSRGQEWVLNEQSMTATLAVNADLGNYSAALGSAQVLSNGNLDFNSGLVDFSSGQSIEVAPDGTVNYVQQMSGFQYRSYFVSNLYGGAINNQGLLDPDFERPNQGTGDSAYAYDPTGSPWSYSGEAGLAGNGSALTNNNPNAPEGTQVAFLQGTGSTISQTANSLAPGAYQLSISAAQGGNNGTGNNETIQVEVDGTVVGTLTPTDANYATYTTPSFDLTAGNHIITFVGDGPDGTDYIALFDQVSIVEQAPGSATFLKTDIATEGNWQGVYGSDGYNVIDNAVSYPSYATVSASGNSDGIWTTSTTDPRALQDASDSGRTAAVWWSAGSFTINVNITDGQKHQLALYLLDWDQYAGGRSEQIQIIDALSGEVLDTETASDFSNGVYMVWNVSGDIEISITNLNGPSNAVLSGLFFDPPGSGSSSSGSGSATFVTTDTTTQGNWQGVYGSDGYNVIDNAASYPSYATVSASGNSDGIWTTSTTDPRALQDASDSGRTAAVWWSAGSFTINVNITDGQKHQLALYLLDWDQFAGGRSEQIQILDATTGAVLDTETASNFSNGEYLVWNVGGDVVVRITNLNGSSNAVLSGLFFDPPGSGSSSSGPGSGSSSGTSGSGSSSSGSGSATFVSTDPTTQGNWQGVYGSDGYNVIDNAVNYPSYAIVSASGNSNGIWTTATSDPRALQDAVGTGRTAAVWWSATSFTVDINLTDGQTHQLALYLLDWDQFAGGRSEQIQILDATTGAVLDTEMASNFSNGEYLVWNVSGSIVARITNLNGNSNAVLSGMFFDPVVTTAS